MITRPFISCSTLFCATFLIGPLLLGGCTKSPPEGESRKSAAPAAIPVELGRAARGDVDIRVRAIGWIEPLNTVTVRPQVSGLLEKIHFAEGQEVRAGDLLFTIDPKPFDAALRLAEASLARDEATRDSSQREYNIVMDLFEHGQASDRERSLAQADAESKAAQAQASSAELERARLERAYCEIRAAISGRAGAYLINAGNVVKAGESDLVTLNQLSPAYVSFSLAESYLAQVSARTANGQPEVTAELTGEESRPEVGRLAFIDNQVDKNTGMIRLKAEFENASRRLWPGRFVNVSMVTETLRNVVSVPASAVQPGQGKPFVFVIAGDDKAEMRLIQAGPTADGRTIIREGLSGDEVVVTDGQLRVTPGVRVEARNRLSSAAAGPGEAAR